MTYMRRFLSFINSPLSLAAVTIQFETNVLTGNITVKMCIPFILQEVNLTRISCCKPTFSAPEFAGLNIIQLKIIIAHKYMVLGEE